MAVQHYASITTGVSYGVSITTYYIVNTIGSSILQSETQHSRFLCIHKMMLVLQGKRLHHKTEETLTAITTTYKTVKATVNMKHTNTYFLYRVGILYL